MKKIQKEKGITLIALIIIIIILIIILGVIFTGINNTIIDKAEKGADKYKKEAKDELSILYLYSRELAGTGEKIYNITDKEIPSYITDSSSIEGELNKSTSIGITFINHDNAIKENLYSPTTVYRKLKKNASISIEITDSYILYFYACANSNDDNKGNIKVINLETNEIETTYVLPNRKAKNVEPLQVVLKAGNYKIATTYETMLFKMQLFPTQIQDNTTNNNENDGQNNEVDNKESTWNAKETIPDWLHITKNNGLRTSETPFTDTSMNTAIKVKTGFSIDLGEKTYNITLYITGSSSERTLTLEEDSSFSQKLKSRNVTNQEPIILQNKTGTLNFKVSGESQLYSIVLTEVK